MSNEITAYFKGRAGVSESLYQYDYGMVLNFDGIELPSSFECYFDTTGSDEAIPAIGTDGRVAIPNDCLSRPGDVTLHIPLHSGVNDSQVEYVVKFRVIGRARPVDGGTPEQQTAIEQALALLQNPITNIEQIVNEALDFTGDTFDEMQAKQTEFESEINSDFEQLNSQFNNLATNVKANSVNTLWTGTLKAKNDSATLSESVANFDYIDIYTGSTDNRCVRKKVSDLSSVVKIQGQNLYDMSGAYGLAESEIHLSISGTTATIVKTINFSWNGEADQAADSSADSYDAECPIIRIDGVKIGSYESAELTDIRVGADGVTYNSAGAAVRGQLTDLKADISDLDVKIETGIIYFPISDFKVGFIKDNGDIASYNYRVYTHVFHYADEDITLSINAGYRVSLIIYNSANASDISTTSGWVAGDRAYTVPKGKYYRFSIQRYPEDSSVPAVISTFRTQVHRQNLNKFDNIKLSSLEDIKALMSFGIGATDTSTGALKSGSKYRISSAMVKFSNPVAVKADVGYRFQIYLKTGVNAVSPLDWNTFYIIPSNTDFIISFAQATPEDTSLVITDAVNNNLYKSISVTAVFESETGAFEYPYNGLKVNKTLDFTMWGQSACVIGNKVVGFGSASADHLTTASVYITNLDDYHSIGTITHNISHAPSADYNNDTDTIIIANGNVDVTTAKIYLVENATDYIDNLTNISYDDDNVVAIDFSSLGTGSCVACFGESSDIVYMLCSDDANWTTNRAKHLYRVFLGKGANDLTATYPDDSFGTYISGRSGYNGTAIVLNHWYGEWFGETQGLKYINGRIVSPTDVVTNYRTGKTGYILVVKMHNDEKMIIEDAFSVPYFNSLGVVQNLEPQDIIFYNHDCYIKAGSKTYICDTIGF